MVNTSASYSATQAPFGLFDPLLSEGTHTKHTTFSLWKTYKLYCMYITVHGNIVEHTAKHTHTCTTWVDPIPTPLPCSNQ